MIDVREVLRRWQAKQSARHIACESGTDRKTIARYVEAAVSCALDATSDLTDEVVAEVAQRVQARPLPEPSEERQLLERHRLRIEQWLGAARPLRLVRIHELLAREGVEISYTTLRRFAHDELTWREPRVTVRVDDPPFGEEAQVDFGLLGHPRRGPSPSTVGLHHHAVGEPLSVRVADALSPTFQKSFAEYTQTRGIFADPARVQHPRDKPRVENQVPYVREPGQRVLGTTRQVPREVYDAEEKPKMLPPPSSPFDVPRWATAKIHPDHRAQVGRARYSLPTRYSGKTLEVRADQSSVRFYLGAALVKTHPRVPPGRRATDPNDFPADRSAYALRSIDGVRSTAATKGEHVVKFVARLLDGALPWIRMRQAYAVLRLCDRYGIGRVDSLCARALAFDVIDVRRVERMLKTAQSSEITAEAEGKRIELPGRFARDAAAFITRRSSDDGGEK